VIVRQLLGARSALCAVSSQRTRGPQSTPQLTYCNNPAALRASVQKLNITYLKTFESADTPATHRIRSILWRNHFRRPLLCSADRRCHSWHRST